MGVKIDSDSKGRSSSMKMKIKIIKKYEEVHISSPLLGNMNVPSQKWE